MRMTLASLSLALGLVVGEATVRWLAPQQLIEVDGPAIWRPDGTFGWRHNENVSARVNTGEGPVHFVTDRRGYRVDPARLEAEPEIPVLALGDSSIEAPQVEADAAIPAVLGRLLTELCGRTVGVANSGVSGWSPLQYRLEGQRALARERYDLGIVFVYTDNDTLETTDMTTVPAQIMLPAQPRWPTRLAWDEVVASILQPANDWLRTRSHLFLFVKLRMHPLLTTLGMTRVNLPEIYRVTERGSARWDTTASVARAIADDFAHARAPVMFVLLPAPYQVDRRLMEQYVESLRIPPRSIDVDQPTVLLLRSFAERGLQTVDMLPRMRELSSTGTSLYGSVDRHLNMDGHRAVAEEVAAVAAALIGCRR